jgi:hypothetical protein
VRRHLVEDPVGGERLLKRLGLAAGAVEDRDVAEHAAGAATVASDLDGEVGFVV